MKAKLLSLCGLTLMVVCASRFGVGQVLGMVGCVAVVGLVLGLTCRAALAEPRTLYKTGDIENARRNVAQYPWAQEIVKGLESRVAYARAQDRAFFEGFIPALTPTSFYGQNCPACVGKKSVMGETGLFQWKIESPDELTCTHCGTVYPNEEYPETGVLECPRMGQTFTYYQTEGERAHPDQREHALKWLGDRPVMTSFSGMVRFGRVRWSYGQVKPLAELYALTGEVAYAERVAWILDRFAQVYPGYLYHSYDGSVADWPPSEVAENMGRHETEGGPRGGKFPKDAIRNAYGLNQEEDYSTLFNGFWGAGRISPHGKGSDIGPLLDMTVAFDLIRDAVYPDGRRVLEEEAEKRILEDLIVAGCSNMEHWDSVSNKGVAVFVLSAAVGVLLEQPERVRQGLAGFNKTMETRYHFDGFYTESPAYSAHNFSNMYELADVLYGYSDPAGYRAEDGSRIDNLDLFSTGRFNLSLLSMVRLLAPGEYLPVIGDTVYDTALNVIFAEVMAARMGGQYAGLLETVQEAALAEKGSEYALWYRSADLKAVGASELPLHSEWFPGWHVGVLRGGRKENDTALFLNGNENQWTLHTGHRQRDVLSLSYYGLGEELVTDRGYVSGSGHPGQRWARASMSHNLVVVDGENQADTGCGSNLELFGTAPGVEVIQASGANVYAQCEEYRRTNALVRLPGGNSYVVDFFRVKGGQRHQYSFHCNGSLVSAHPGESVEEEIEWLSNLRSATLETANPFTWEHRDIRTDLRLLNGVDSVDRILIADAPGWRRASAEELALPPIQQVLAEHWGDRLTTQYAAVVSAYRGEISPVLEARLLENDPDSGVMAIEVKLEGRTDYVVSTRDQVERQFGPVTVAGEFAFVSMDGEGNCVQAYLLKGTRLVCGKEEIVLAEAATTVKVERVEDRTFHLAGSVEAVEGSYVLVGMDPRTGFEIESVMADAITVRAYPVVSCDEVTVLHSGWVEKK
ncbi:MAG: heparinase II/III family protein [bacterium]|nr:heparinase II/III family protein [bacterium]